MTYIVFQSALHNLQDRCRVFVTRPYIWYMHLPLQTVLQKSAMFQSPGAPIHRYNAVQFIAILHMTLRWQRRNVNQTSNPQHGRAMGCLLWEFEQHCPCYNGPALYYDNAPNRITVISCVVDLCMSDTAASIARPTNMSVPLVWVRQHKCQRQMKKVLCKCH